MLFQVFATLAISLTDCYAAYRTPSFNYTCQQCNIIILDDGFRGPNSTRSLTAYSTCPSLSCRPDRPFQVCESGFDTFDCRGDLERHPDSDYHYLCLCGQQATLDPLLARNMSIDDRPVLLDRYNPTTCSSSTEDGPCDVATSFKLCSWIDTYSSQHPEPSCRLLLVDNANPTLLYDDRRTPRICDGNNHTFMGLTTYACKCSDVEDSTEPASSLPSCPPMQYARDNLVDVDTGFQQIPLGRRDLTPIIEELPGVY